MKRLFALEFTTIELVYADSAEEARALAHAVAQDVSLTDALESITELSETDPLPPGYEMTSCVWHKGDDDITVEDALAGVAPEYDDDDDEEEEWDEDE